MMAEFGILQQGHSFVSSPSTLCSALSVALTFNRAEN